MACLDENQVLALVHGRLSGDALQEAQQHLDRCVDCLDLVGFYQQSAQDAENEVDTYDHDFVPLSESEEIDLKAPGGSKIGRYEVIRALGRGGMGVVYLARDPELDRRVALKLVKPSLQSDERADHFEKRLMREARAMAQLAHPNVLTIYDVGIQEGQVFLASEWVDGCTMDEWMEAGHHRWPSIVQIFREAARGLVAAHSAGLIHRDFKPSNVMVGKDERVRVFDFGLVKSTKANIGDITTQLSGNFVVGTPAYMAPEQMVGKTADERSDQFSFCASMYEALAGVRPFSGRNLTELLTNIGAGKLEEPKKIPKWLWDLIRRGLKRKPEDRYESMAAVLQILDAGMSHRRRRSLMAVAGVVLVGGATFGAASLWQQHGSEEDHCGSLAIELGSAWNADTRAGIASAAMASELPFAKQSWQSASSVFDKYAVDWKRELRASCIETRITKKQSPALEQMRSDCFERLRSELASVTSQLADGTKETLGSMVVLAAGLSPIASCSASRAQGEFTLLPEGEDATAARKLWPRVQEVDSLVVRGNYHAALDQSSELLEEKHGNRRAEARLWSSRGKALRLLGDYEEAVLALEASFYAAVAGRNDDIAARVTTDIFSILQVHLQDEVRAGRWQQLSESAVERVNTPIARGRWHRVQGNVAMAKRDYGKAEGHFRASLKVLEPALGSASLDVARSVGALGRAQARSEDASPALATQERAVQLWSSLLGPQHAETATAQIDLAAVLAGQGKTAEAKALVEEANRALVVALGEENARVAWALNAMAEYHVAEGEHSEASQTLLRALRIKRGIHGSSHPQLVSTLINLMEVDRMLGRFSDAVIHGEEALEILTDGPGNAQRTLRLKLSIAEARLASGNALAAEAACGALGAASEAAGPTLRGRVLSCLGQAALAQGKKKEGQTRLREAVAAFGSAAKGHRLALALFAQARSKSGQKSLAAEALAEAEQARQLLAAAGGAWSTELALVEAWLDALGTATSAP